MYILVCVYVRIVCIHIYMSMPTGINDIYNTADQDIIYAYMYHISYTIYVHIYIYYTHLPLDLDHVVEDEVGQHGQSVVAHHHIRIVQSVI